MGRLIRRTFLLGAAAMAGGVAVGYVLYRRPHPNPLVAGPGEAVFNPYVKIAADGSVTVVVPRAEMGQGVTTTLAALVIEELGADWGSVRVEHGPAAAAYYNEAMIREAVPYAVFDTSFAAETARDVNAVVAKFLGMQATAGSTSAIDGYQRMRQAGAAAREMLIAAAAERWGVPAASLEVEGGRIVDAALGRSLGFGELAEAAARHKPPRRIALKEPARWRLIGTSLDRLDIPDKVIGTATFGIDVQLPDLLFATVRMNPRRGRPMRAFDAGKALAMAGVVTVVDIGGGIAAIADNTWRAFRAAEAVEIDWDGEAADEASDERTRAVLAARLAEGDKGWVMRDDGDAAAAFAAAAPGDLVAATYRTPYLAHACMEPMNATAQWTGERLTVWSPNQSPTAIQAGAAREFGIPAEAVTVHTTLLGGGFGRRYETDFSLLAARVARHTGGRPVKVTWTREEDIRHDMYRPAGLCEARAVLGPDRLPAAVELRIAGQSVMRSTLARTSPGTPVIDPDTTLTEGAYNQPYAIASYRVSGHPVELPVPVGFWRSVGNSHNAFFHECFLDEIAHAGGHDPVELRLALMRDHPAARRVVEAAAAMAGWGTPLDTAGVKARGRGIAFCLSFGAWVAQAVQVADTEAGLVVEAVWCAADFGRLLDPRNLEAQLQSGIVFGLSAAIGQEITFRAGAVEQSNFHDFDALRIDRCPKIEVRLLETVPRLGGAGEPGTPPIAPALANAVFAATGRRVRELPLARSVRFA